MIPLVFALLLVQEKTVVEGVVRNALTNEPLRKAAVTLAAKKSYTAVSSGDGKFRVEQLDPGSYQLRVQRQGFLDSDDDPPVDVAAGQHGKDVVIKLTPQGIIAGHVVDEDGDPVADAGVRAERWVLVSGRKVSFGSWQETTNAEGYFFIGDLQPGRYHLSAAPPEHRPRADDGPREDLVRGELPTAVDLLPGGVSREIEIALKKSAVFRVRGRVPNKPDALSLHLASDTEEYNARVQRDGTFTFDIVEPGNCILSISNGSFQRPATMFCRIPVVVSDHDVEGLVAELTPGAAIEGTIKMQGDGKFEEPPYLQLMGLFPNNAATAKEDGTFGWTNLASKEYWVDYGPPKGCYVKSILFNHQPSTGMLDLTSGAGGTLEIVVAPNAATIAVTVEGGKRAHVALWNNFKSDWSDTQPDGTATFEHLAPGEYRIAAWEKGDSDYLRIPEFRERFDAQTIKVAEGSHLSFQVKLIPKSASDAEIARFQ